jgi:hypothetical protein
LQQLLVIDTSAHAPGKLLFGAEWASSFHSPSLSFLKTSDSKAGKFREVPFLALALVFVSAPALRVNQVQLAQENEVA